MNNFELEEFQCPCCKVVGMTSAFLEKIDKARSISGVPYHINSGYRCFLHNREVGGSESSSHLSGHAADIKATDSRSRYKILTGLLVAGFKRIGIGKDFIHVDDDQAKPEEVIWDYYKEH